MIARKGWKCILDRRRSRNRPSKRWKDEIEDVLAKHLPTKQKLAAQERMFEDRKKWRRMLISLTD